LIQNAINSRLADDIRASEGDNIVLSYGAKDPLNPMGMIFMQSNFTVEKIISEEDLKGKANYNQRKTVFLELDILQDMLNRQDEINLIWISNKGDYSEGGEYTDKVNSSIEEELDTAVGMTDLGLSLDIVDSSLVLSSITGFFPLHYAEHLNSLAEETNRPVINSLMVPTVRLNNNLIQNLMVMGIESNDPHTQPIENDTIYFLESVADGFSIANGTMVTIVTTNLEGMEITTQLKASILPAEYENTMPAEIKAITMGVVDFDTGQFMLHGRAYEEDMATFVIVSNLDNSTRNQLYSDVTELMDSELGGSDLNLEVHNAKADGLEMARSNGESIGILFLIFGMFAIIAGIVRRRIPGTFFRMDYYPGLRNHFRRYQ
jgi:hypothetical protein